MDRVRKADPNELGTAMVALGPDGKPSIHDDVLEAVKMKEVQDAAEHARKADGTLPPGWWQKYRNEILSQPKVAESAATLSKSAQERTLNTELRTKIGMIGKLAKMHGEDVESYLPIAESIFPEARLTWRKMFGGSPDMGANKAERLERYRTQVILDLKSDIAGVLNSDRGKKLGGSQTEGELANYAKEISDKHSVLSLSNWLNKRAAALDAERSAALGGLTPYQKEFVLRNTGFYDAPARLPTPSIPGYKPPPQAPAGQASSKRPLTQ
jgi:hypothetical protein